MSTSRDNTPTADAASHGAAWSAEKAAALVAPLTTQPGPLIEALHALQRHFGYVDERAVPLLAETLNLSRADVHGVLSFYHYFRTTPPGRHTLRICRAEACQSMGAAALVRQAEQTLGCDLHETSADGAVSLEPVYCLGNCACAPAVMVDETLHGRVDGAKLDALVAELREAVA